MRNMWQVSFNNGKTMADKSLNFKIPQIAYEPQDIFYKAMFRGLFEKQGYDVKNVEIKEQEVWVECNINETPLKRMILICNKQIVG
jgi:hypothetical protein